MANIDYLDPEVMAADEARFAYVETVLPNWQERESHPERFVSETDFYAATEADWDDLDFILDWEAFGGFHNP
jgi:hypothetical protein